MQLLQHAVGVGLRDAVGENLEFERADVVRVPRVNEERLVVRGEQRRGDRTHRTDVLQEDLLRLEARTEEEHEGFRDPGELVCGRKVPLERRRRENHACVAALQERPGAAQEEAVVLVQLACGWRSEEERGRKWC